jgi:UDP-4-amino-4,6-dideoxy-N-acetyl-beta-L-altrosamine transaminase
MIPYGRQDISQADIDAVVEVLQSDWLTQGPMVPRFEQAVASYAGAQHALAVNSATSALHIACLALCVGPGDWVWTSPNTFVASANCALYCSAKVDFVDIDPRTYNMSVERLAEKLEQAKAANRMPKVVIPVHFAGQPCDMPAIHKLSQKYGFKIIEDASHAIGASYAPESFIARSGEAATWQSSTAIKVGSCTHSHITVFSFHPVKIITTGEGGMALTNDVELAEKMARLRTHGISNKPEFMHSRPPEEIWNYQQIDLGFNYRMTDIQAVLGLSQLQRLDDFVAKRREIAAIYDQVLSNLPIITPWQDPRMQSSHHLYSVLITHECCGWIQRDVYQALHQSGVLVNLHYIPVHRQPYYERMGFEQGYCLNAEQYHRAAISLPMYSSLSEEQQHKVVTTLKAVLGK